MMRELLYDNSAGNALNMEQLMLNCYDDMSHI